MAMQRPLKAIIVEDDDTLRKAFAYALESDPNITTVEAPSLSAAVRVCRGERQPVLLVDLGLPDAEGVEAVDKLRRELPGATLVVVTGRVEQVEAAKLAGAHEVILKGSVESHGAALNDVIRRAVVRHDAMLLFDPMRKLQAERESLLGGMKKAITLPLVALTLLAGSTFAAGRSDAAELRAANERVALEWWAVECQQ